MIDPLVTIGEGITALIAKERALWEAYENAELDVRLANRDADAAIIAAAQKSFDKARSEWHAAFLEAQAETRKLISGLGVPFERIRALL